MKNNKKKVISLEDVTKVSRLKDSDIDVNSITSIEDVLKVIN